ncbi:MAG: alpha/beta fold hydrolase [Pseudomonadota bacterium]
MENIGSEILLFEDFELDVGAVELRKAGEPIPLEPQVFDLIRLLASRPGQVVSRDEIIDAVWDGRIVSESAVSTRINAARKALADDGSAQRIIKTVHGRGFRFEGAVSADDQLRPDQKSEVEFSGVRYIRSFDGTNIAYEVAGVGPPIVKTPSFLNHIEMDHSSPVNRHWINEAARKNRYIRFDQRGTGLSDRNIEDFSFESYLQDMLKVLDGTHTERAVLLGLSQGCPQAIAFAHRHPERVAGLILHGGYVAGWRAFGDPDLSARREAMLELVRVGWGGDNPAFRQAYTSMFVPGGTKEQHDWFNEMQRLAASPENAWRILDSFGDIDVRPLIADVEVPTLVTHSRGDQVVFMEAGRQFAVNMPNARFVALESDNHVLLEDEPAWLVFKREVRAFLDEIGW